MFIKSIVLDGFKSYGHRTEITGFDKQFNAITGLNGSGKSNILDSICFVLGITNLSQVRAGNLQDLIYKSGQCGINKATVSITFDNSNPDQCPPGFENISEITVTRQIVMGGKNKYMINGSTVPNKKVQDLFCSIQLNVNNPHFLIMQGKITKVLNMKPYDILAMIEEAAGTKMYEVKRQACQKTIEKKDAKLNELKTVIDEELCPRLEKLRTERAKYMEYKNLERTLEDMLHTYQAWEYLTLQKRTSEAKNALTDEENKIKEIETNLLNHKNQVKQVETEIEDLSKKIIEDKNEDLQKLEVELKSAEKLQANTNASLKSIKENINSEKKRKTQLEKNASEDEKALRQKESELGKVEAHFQQLKQKDEEDTNAFVTSQKRYEALCAGMELSETGEAETLLEQLMNARKKETEANSEIKQTLLRLNFCEGELKKKRNLRNSNANEIMKDQNNLENLNKDVKQLETNIKRISFNEEHFVELQNRRKVLLQEIQSLRVIIDDFESRRPHTQFRYRDPESNFNRKSVFGVVCRLLKVKDDNVSIAIETAAGGKLYNVAVDTDLTGKKLLQKGDLQQRTTFIPLNKIQSHKMSESTIQLAQELVGKENVQPALHHLTYDKKLQAVMDFIFGNVFICKDINVGKQIAFHERIKRRCVTLDGDVVDPAGTLSGGAAQKGGSVLKQLKNIQQNEEELALKESELEKIDREIQEMSTKQKEYVQLTQKLELKQHDIHLINQRLQLTSHYKNQEEIGNLNNEIDQLRQKIEECRESEAEYNKKVKELEGKVKNSESSKEDQLKQAENEMKKLKMKADKSKNDWKQKEQDYETFKLEISEFKNGLELTRQQIKNIEDNINNLEEKYNEALTNSQEINEKVESLQGEVKKEKGKITEKNKSIQKKVHKKEELQAEINEFEVKIKESSHRVKELKNDYKNLKTKQTDSEKRVKHSKLKEAEQITDEKGHKLEREIRKAQETKNNLGRTINSKAQTLFEQQDKEYQELRRKQNIVKQDKRKIVQIMEDLDKKKRDLLTRAHEQISKDFGSIFSTLLPGANAKLLPPPGQTILQGLEVKVSLGGVWKESLTELSGGQRSLAALSLILAMLLFKPAPLYILDEVDAALDLSHTQNIGNMLKTHFKKSQFIIVSLKDGMFNNANVLFRTQFVDGVSAITRTVNKNRM